jgi:transposase-like protein
MSHSVRKGFCRDCRANVQQVRRFDSKLLWLFDALTFRFASRFRVGSWHCLQCTRKSVYLRLPRPGARNIVIGGERTTEASVETAGNYIQRDRSLIASQERSSRYSPKYRESIVQKILDGHVTIAEIRRELNLSESDIISWIGIVVRDKSEKIEQLTQVIQAISDDRPPKFLETTNENPDDVIDVNTSNGS